MNRYLLQKNNKPRSSTVSDNDKTAKKKRQLFFRTRQVQSHNNFENYLMLGTLDSSGKANSENLLNLIKRGDSDGLGVFLTDKPEFLRIKDQLQGCTLMHYAVEYDKSSIIDRLVELGVDIHATDYDGNTPLHWAAVHDSPLSMLALLGHGADYKILNNESESILHTAVILNKIDLMKTLLYSGHDIDLVIHGSKGKTPLHYAAELDNIEMIELFSEYGEITQKSTDGKSDRQFRLCSRDDENNAPIHTAARAGAARVLEFFFKCCKEHGYSHEFILSLVSSENSTPLHNAVDGGHTEVIKLLIQYGADPFCTQGQLLPPFHIAASMSNPSCIKAMISEIDKDKIDSKDQEGMTGLLRAIININITVAKLLLDIGADPSVKYGTDENTVLHTAVMLNSESCVNLLLSYGADYFSINGNGDTILHLALCLPNIKVIEKILGHEQVYTLAKTENVDGLRPIQLAVRYNKLEPLKQLLELRSCKMVHDSYTDLLHISAEQGHLQLTQYIIEENYKLGRSIINDPNSDGITPLHLAAREGHIEVVKLLLKFGAILHHCPKGFSPFALATLTGSLRTLQILLESFKYAKDMSTYNGDTPLHIAASNGHSEIVTFLLDKNAKITLNNEGTTFFYSAIMNDHSNVVSVTLKHKRWQEALDILATSKPPPFAALVIRMPSLAKIVLDRCIEKSSFSDIKKDNWISYNFKYLVPPPNLPVLQRPSTLSPTKSMGEGDGTSSISFSLSSTLRATENLFEYKKVDQMYVLDMMRKYERRNLLKHPLVSKFLQCKWVRYGSSFYFLSFIFFLVFLILLSAFTIVYRPIYNCETPSWSSVSLSNNPNASYLNSSGYYAYRGILDILAFGYLGLLILGIFLAKHKLSYTISMHFIVELLCYISTLVFLPLHTPCPIWSAGAFAIFFGWLTFVFYIGQYGIFALYTRMLIAVFKTVFYMLPLVVLLICAFAFAFFILLSPVIIELRDIERSLLFVFQMLIGDPKFEFVTDFAFADATEGKLPSKGVSYFFLIFAGLLITIILTNLLIGLAVGDIANVREGAFLKRVKDRIIFFGNMDRSLPGWVKRDAKYLKIIEYPDKHRFGAVSVIWKHILELFAPNSEEEMEDIALNADTDFDRKMNGYEKNVDELKEMVAKSMEIISAIRKEVSPRKLSAVDSLDH
ncbi:Transient receptor potential cation channel [Oopsacas minuta]|uniref:Transient receptor potential cation channel n=1 Tax=Oopsacas minuta TaxID=111878 RepID=A0AAV7JT25_9METZ|nr:Transient receptor potential cation channel [Oopsacas minuta]